MLTTTRNERTKADSGFALPEVLSIMGIIGVLTIMDSPVIRTASFALVALVGIFYFMVLRNRVSRAIDKPENPMTLEMPVVLMPTYEFISTGIREFSVIEELSTDVEVGTNEVIGAELPAEADNVDDAPGNELAGNSESDSEKHEQELVASSPAN